MRYSGRWSERMLAAVAFISLFCLALQTLGAEPDIPPAEELVDSIRSGHPRLFFRDGDFAELRERVEENDRLSRWAEEIRQDADQMAQADPVYYHIPDGKRLLSVSRRLLDRVRTLALLYQLAGDRKYLEGAVKELNAASKFKDWNPSHFLDTAEMTQGFALGYDWLYEGLTPAQRKRYRTAIVELGLTPGLKCYRGEAGYGWWRNSSHNWNQVCNGGLALGAIAVADNHPEVAGEILNSALKSVRKPMKRYAPDGGWDEGPSYWHYATRYTVSLLAGLNSAMGTDFGLSDYEGFDRAGEFLIHIHGPLDKTFNFADAHGHSIAAPEMFWLARRFDRPVYNYYQLHYASPSVLDLSWYRGGKATPPSEALPLSATFGGPEVATMRTAWGSTRATFAAVKGGRPQVNHGHADGGTFVLDALGERWAIELGSDDYNMPGYFGGKRWTYYRLRAEGHNTLVLNPDKGAGQRTGARAEISRFSREDGGAFTVLDLTPLYQDSADSLKRGLRVRKDGCVVVQDELKAPEPVKMWWFMHTRADIDVSESGDEAVLSRGGEKLRATIVDGPSGATFEVRAARPLPSSPDPEMQRKNGGVRKLSIHAGDVKKTTLCVLLQPVEDGEGDAAGDMDVRPLAQW